MSEEQLKAFLEKAQGDISLQEKLKAAADANAVAGIAKEAGFAISADDINKAQSEISEITEEDLESIAGGRGWAYHLANGSALCPFDDKWVAWIKSGGKDQS